MVFTPFTGVDHHKRSIIFCGALIAKEDYESFNWAFSRFLIAMLGKEPEYIITDEDTGIIKSVLLVFKTARHRFYMWHILNKVPSKFGVMREDYHDFMILLNEIMWDEDLEAEEFDAQWISMFQKHRIGDNNWFADKYSIRKQWVMAHCIDLRMGHNEIILLLTPSTLEASCSWRVFERSGILCRHLIWIYSSNGVKSVPDAYIAKRWTKDATRFRMFNCDGEGTKDIDIIDRMQLAMSTMWSEFHQTVSILRLKDKACVERFSTLIREFRDNLSPSSEALNKNQQLQMLLGCPSTEEINIQRPKNSTNKGSGKRLLSSKTKVVAP
ncbi:protein FAR1-RELATED SEQUENCE 5-like [Silene latifolia]|uniref:protein FAR1-RELATED SEQUENCE 5-like n=1 Tax=Silene latifolia TaxID=37657 RepID=UPI003D76FA5E